MRSAGCPGRQAGARRCAGHRGTQRRLSITRTLEEPFTVALTLRDNYAFTVEFAEGEGASLVVDELPPLGTADGPNPARLLAAAVGSCLSASLLFCLRKSHIEVAQLRTTVDGTIVRNARGRLRIGGLRVRLVPELSTDQRERMQRCLDLFQDFCIVTESVRDGIAVDVEVETASADPRQLVTR